MSLNAWREIQLERKRKEELRLERVKEQCRALLATCETEITQVKEPAVQQLAAKGLQRVRKELREASAQVEQAPDRTLKAVRAAQKKLHTVIADAQAEAHRWSKEQAAVRARIEASQSRAAAERQTANEAGAQVLTQVDRTLTEASALSKQGRYLEAASRCEQVESLMDQADKASFDETVRREVVRNLLSTLQEMGFIVEGPSLRKQDSEPGVVSLAGRLPSGKSARFDIQLDGQLHYDLDGYEGRTCAQQVERIEETLRDRFGIKLGPAQVTWKNPDRISKGARDLPSGSRRGSAW